MNINVNTLKNVYIYKQEAVDETNNDTNFKYINKHELEKYIIITAIKNNKMITCYNNFIVIENETYNGWTKNMIVSLINTVRKQLAMQF